MAHPKRQHSKQRQRKRRTHDSLSVPNLFPCSHCNELIQSHRICPHCGYYKNESVIAVKQANA